MRSPKINRGVCSLEGLMLKLKLQYFGHLMQRADSFEKTLMLGKIEGRRRRDDRGWDGWMASPLNRHEVEQALRVGAGPGSLACCSPWRCKELEMTERLNWTEGCVCVCPLFLTSTQPLSVHLDTAERQMAHQIYNPFSSQLKPHLWILWSQD